METSEKINQLIAGIMCEYNMQNAVAKELKPVPNSTYNQKFAKHELKILDKLSSLFDDVCEFSNATDINDDANVAFNDVIGFNIRNE